jgi:ferredoxin
MRKRGNEGREAMNGTAQSSPVSALPHLPGSPLPVLVAAYVDRLDQSACDGCDLCGTRCTAGVPFTRDEFQATEAELARLPAEEVARVVGQEKQVPIPGGEGATYTACRFRDVAHGRCLVYRARPMICRVFGHAEWLPCPAGLIPTTTGAVEMMQAYSTHERHTYEEWQALLTTDSANDSSSLSPRFTAEPTDG